MHGILSGALLGMGVIAFVGVYRSLQNWKNSKRRPPVWVLGIQLVAQAAIGLTSIVFALWFMFAGE